MTISLLLFDDEHLNCQGTESWRQTRTAPTPWDHLNSGACLNISALSCGDFRAVWIELELAGKFLAGFWKKSLKLLDITLRQPQE